MDTDTASWIRWIDPDVRSRLGGIRHALFDFDGTISVLRQGWEEVMAPLMIESICGNALPSTEIVNEVKAYIDRTTGILTIRQMEWLVTAVRRHGLNGTPKSARAYKALYLQRLMQRVHSRLQRLNAGEDQPERQCILGALAFVRGLAKRGVQLYLASGTDHADVVNEADALGILSCFCGGIYGALDENETNAKDRVIQNILDSHHLQGEELIVIGDGPVELREAKQRGAIALGVASDEIHRCGWNEHKIERLVSAGADFLVADFEHATDLLNLLCKTVD
ncbi:MAG TPA: HAD family hydrolase [Anaerolineaceae bacterium]